MEARGSAHGSAMKRHEDCPESTAGQDRSSTLETTIRLELLIARVPHESMSASVRRSIAGVKA